jgi:diguanylate cyclase (GGDEF)-like protein
MECVPAATAGAGSRFAAARGVRAALLAVSALALLALWLLPDLAELRSSRQFFPVALHTIFECAAIVVCLLVFAVAWHAFRPQHASNVAVLACGFLAVAILDFGHALSYEGMPDFVTPASPDKAIAFWLCARFAADLTLVYVCFTPWRPFAWPRVRFRLLQATLLGVAWIFYVLLSHPGAVPWFFDPERGLTVAKLAAEWIGIGLLCIVVLRLRRLRTERLGFDVDRMIIACQLLILASISLSLYTNPHDIFILIGHACKVAAFYVVYRAVFVASVRQPYEQLTVEIALKETAERKVMSLSYFDSLTGLPNAAHLREKVEQALASRRGGERIALMIASLDGFTYINETYGHAFGDRVLKMVADRLARRAARFGSAFRLDGDRFVILVDDQRACNAIGEGAERLRAEIAEPMRVLGAEIAISASVGISIAPDDAGDCEGLLKNASSALRTARGFSGGSWLVYQPSMSEKAIERVNLRSGLRHALERNEFTLHYQPQFDLRAPALIGAEALLRWTHPDDGLVSPARFIPEAEESGLIVPLGNWVLKEACRQAMKWRREGFELPAVAVNISARQFEMSNVEDAVREALYESQLPAHALELEVTESTFIRDTESILDTLQRLRAVGVRVSIDDFGTGYSCLAYLHVLPIDKIKIDQSFVRSLRRNAGSEAVVSTIIQLARSLNMGTVAEGVEDEASAAILLRLGCRQAQGHLYGKPMPADEMTAFLTKHAHGDGLPGPGVSLRPQLVGSG